MEDGPPIFSQDNSCPDLLNMYQKLFVYGAITLYRSLSRAIPLQLIISASPLSLAATKGISIDFFSYGYLDVSVPRVRLLHLCIQCKIPINRWVSPFGNLRIKACLTSSPSLSQSTTSFIASSCQGIHHVRLFT